MRRWIGLAVAAAFALNAGVTTSVAFAAPAAAPAPMTYNQWSAQVGALTMEASETTKGFETWLNLKSDTREELMAFARRELPNLRQARAALRQVQAKFSAFPAYNGDPEETRIAASLLKDGRDYTRRMDAAFGAVEDLLVAVVAGDDAAASAALPKLVQVGDVLIEGQIAAARSRQALFARTDGGYFIMGAMVSLYEGMKAAFNVSLRTLTPAEAAVQMRASAKRCRALVAAGQPVVDRSLAAAAPRDKAYFQFDREQLAIGADIAAALEASADVMDRTNDPMEGFRVAITALSDLEVRFGDSASRQTAQIANR